MSRVGRLAVAAFSFAAMIAAASGVRASVATDQSLSNNLVTQAAAPVAASQAAGIIAGAIGGSIGAAPPPVLSLDGERFAGRAPVFNLRQAMRQSGESAGAESLKLNIWANGGYTDVARTDSGGELDGSVMNGVVGVDYLFSRNLIGGVAFGYESSDIDTAFNAGTFEGAGFTVAPYLGYAVSERLSLDASFGYSFVEYDTTTGAAFGGTTSSFDARRYFLAANATGRFMFHQDRLRLSPRLGILYLEEDQDAFVNSAGTAVDENTIALGRVSIGAELGYRIRKIEPFVKGAFEYDWEHEEGVALGNGTVTSDDDMGLVAGAGLNLFLTDGMSGRIEGSMNSLGRENLDVWSVSGKLNYRF